MPSAPGSISRYGVALFPVPVLASVGSTVGFWLFVGGTRGTAPMSDADALGMLATVGLSLAFTAAGVVAALVVLIALVVDARALRRSGVAFSPRPLFAGGVGLVHLVAAAAFSPLYVLSVPPLAYYTYRRFR